MARTQVQARAQSVGFLLVSGFALMSYAAAVEPLRAANLISGKPLYRWWHAAPGGKPVMASNGLAIIPDIGVGTDREVSMLFVCAGGNPATFNDKQVFAWLRKLARRGVTIGGISGGPYFGPAQAFSITAASRSTGNISQPSARTFLTSPWRPLCSRSMATGSPAPEASRPST